MSAMVPANGTPNNPAAVARANPMTLLPDPLIGTATAFFGFYSDALKGSTGLVARLRWWMRPIDEGGEGLTVEDAATAMKALMTPDAAGRPEYAGMVMASLSREVVEVLKKRRAEEKRRRQHEQSLRDEASARAYRESIAGIGEPKE